MGIRKKLFARLVRNLLPGCEDITPEQVNGSLRNGTCELNDLNFQVDKLQELGTEKLPFGMELVSLKIDRVEVQVRDYWRKDGPITLIMGTIKLRAILHAPPPEGMSFEDLQAEICKFWLKQVDLQKKASEAWLDTIQAAVMLWFLGMRRGRFAAKLLPRLRTKISKMEAVCVLPPIYNIGKSMSSTNSREEHYHNLPKADSSASELFKQQKAATINLGDVARQSLPEDEPVIPSFPRCKTSINLGENGGASSSNPRLGRSDFSFLNSSSSRDPSRDVVGSPGSFPSTPLPNIPTKETMNSSFDMGELSWLDSSAELRATFEDIEVEPFSFEDPDPNDLDAKSSSRTDSRPPSRKSSTPLPPQTSSSSTSRAESSPILRKSTQSDMWPQCAVKGQDAVRHGTGTIRKIRMRIVRHSPSYSSSSNLEWAEADEQPAMTIDFENMLFRVARAHAFRDGGFLSPFSVGSRQRAEAEGCKIWIDERAIQPFKCWIDIFRAGESRRRVVIQKFGETAMAAGTGRSRSDVRETPVAPGQELGYPTRRSTAPVPMKTSPLLDPDEVPLTTHKTEPLPEETDTLERSSTIPPMLSRTPSPAKKSNTTSGHNIRKTKSNPFGPNSMLSPPLPTASPQPRTRSNSVASIASYASSADWNSLMQTPEGQGRGSLLGPPVPTDGEGYLTRQRSEKTDSTNSPPPTSRSATSTALVVRTPSGQVSTPPLTTRGVLVGSVTSHPSYYYDNGSKASGRKQKSSFRQKKRSSFAIGGATSSTAGSGKKSKKKSRGCPGINLNRVKALMKESKDAQEDLCEDANIVPTTDPYNITFQQSTGSTRRNPSRSLSNNAENREDSSPSFFRRIFRKNKQQSISENPSDSPDPEDRKHFERIRKLFRPLKPKKYRTQSETSSSPPVSTSQDSAPPSLQITPRDPALKPSGSSGNLQKRVVLVTETEKAPAQQSFHSISSKDVASYNTAAGYNPSQSSTNATSSNSQHFRLGQTIPTGTKRLSVTANSPTQQTGDIVLSKAPLALPCGVSPKRRMTDPSPKVFDLKEYHVPVSCRSLSDEGSSDYNGRRRTSKASSNFFTDDSLQRKVNPERRDSWASALSGGSISDIDVPFSDLCSLDALTDEDDDDFLFHECAESERNFSFNRGSTFYEDDLEDFWIREHPEPEVDCPKVSARRVKYGEGEWFTEDLRTMIREKMFYIEEFEIKMRLQEQPNSSPTNTIGKQSTAASNHDNEQDHEHEEDDSFLQEDWVPDQNEKETAPSPYTILIWTKRQVEFRQVYENFLTEPHLRVLCDLAPTEPSPPSYAGYKKYFNKGLIGPRVRPVRMICRAQHVSVRTSLGGDETMSVPVISLGDEDRTTQRAAVPFEVEVGGDRAANVRHSSTVEAMLHDDDVHHEDAPFHGEIDAKQEETAHLSVKPVYLTTDGLRIVFDKNQLKYLNSRLRAVRNMKRPILSHKTQFYSKAFHFKMYNLVFLSKSAADPRKEVGKLKNCKMQEVGKLKLPARLVVPELEFESVSSLFDLLHAFGPALRE